MDLLHYRKAWHSAGLALGFSLLVAWMVPPTDPKPVAPGWRATIKPVAPPAPVNFIGYAPAMAMMPSNPVEQRAYAGDEMTSGERVAVYQGAASDEALPPIISLPLKHDAVASATDSDRDGYRWAENANAGPGDEPAPAADDDVQGY